MVHAVLRGSPSALACSSSVHNPASIRACPSSWILADWRAFISAMTGRASLVCVAPCALAAPQCSLVPSGL